MHSGTVIRATRQALKMTQEQLGELAEVDHTTVSRIERGLTNPPARTIKALTDALGLAMSERGAA